jgi:hypothetical protein
MRRGEEEKRREEKRREEKNKSDRGGAEGTEPCGVRAGRAGKEED